MLTKVKPIMDENKTKFVEESGNEITQDGDQQSSGNLSPIEQQGLEWTLTSTWNEYQLYCHQWECTSMNPKYVCYNNYMNV